MLRKCKVGKDHRPALFHGFFQFGNLEYGCDGMAIVEFEDGTTDNFGPNYITFDAPPIADNVEDAKSNQRNVNRGSIAQTHVSLAKAFTEETGASPYSELEYDSGNFVPKEEYVEWLEARAEASKPSLKKQITPVCDWCGNGGDLVTKHYHRTCHEAILNGEGMI